MLVLCQKNYNTGARPPPSQPNIRGKSRGKWPCQGTRPEVSQDRGAGEPLRQHNIKKVFTRIRANFGSFFQPLGQAWLVPNIDRSQTRPTLSECRLAPPHPSSRKEMRRTNTHTHAPKSNPKNHLLAKRGNRHPRIRHTLLMWAALSFPPSCHLNMTTAWQPPTVPTIQRKGTEKPRKLARSRTG